MKKTNCIGIVYVESEPWYMFMIRSWLFWRFSLTVVNGKSAWTFPSYDSSWKFGHPNGQRPAIFWAYDNHGKPYMTKILCSRCGEDIQ